MQWDFDSVHATKSQQSLQICPNISETHKLEWQDHLCCINTKDSLSLYAACWEYRFVFVSSLYLYLIGFSFIFLLYYYQSMEGSPSVPPAKNTDLAAYCTRATWMWQTVVKLQPQSIMHTLYISERNPFWGLSRFVEPLTDPTQPSVDKKARVEKTWMFC